MTHVLGGEVMDSILDSIKKLLGIHETYSHFDTDVMMHINTVFAILNQLGVGPEEGFEIQDKYDEWEDFSKEINLNMVKTYVYLQVKMLFDTPVGSVRDAIENRIRELEFRINAEHEKNVKPPEDKRPSDTECPWFD